MAKKLLAKVDTYQKDGETKNKYVELGVILESQHGEYALLDPTVNLAGILMKQRLMDPKKAGASVMVAVFDNDRQAGSNATPQNQPVPENFDDSIPF